MTKELNISYCGQSNVGVSLIQDLRSEYTHYTGINSEVLTYNHGYHKYLQDGGMPAVEAEGIYQLNVGQNTMLYNYTSGKEFGAEASFMYKKKGFLHKFGWGGTSIEDWINTNAFTTIDNFEFIVDYWMTMYKKKFYLSHFIWQQGEKDAKNGGEYVTRYRERLDELFSIIKTGLVNLGVNDNFKIILIETSFPGTDEDDALAVQNAKIDFCNVHSNNAVYLPITYNVMNLMSGNAYAGHMNANNKIKLGLRIDEILQTGKYIGNQLYY